MVFCFEEVDLKRFRFILVFFWEGVFFVCFRGFVFIFFCSILCFLDGDIIRSFFCLWMDYMRCFVRLVFFFVCI